MKTSKHINIKHIYAMAWSFHRTTGLDIDELIAEASVAAVHASNKYQEGSSPHDTFVYEWAKRHLITWSKKQMLKLDCTSITDEEGNDVDLVSNNMTPEDIYEFKQAISNLPKEAADIALMILETPGDFIDSRPKMARGALKRHLKELGWTMDQIWTGMRDLTAFIRTRQTA